MCVQMADPDRQDLACLVAGQALDCRRRACRWRRIPGLREWEWGQPRRARDPVGFRVVQAVEDGQRLLPGGAGSTGVSGRLVRVAEVSQHLGPRRDGLGIAEQPDGLLVTGDGLGVMP